MLIGLVSILIYETTLLSIIGISLIEGRMKEQEGGMLSVQTHSPSDISTEELLLVFASEFAIAFNSLLFMAKSQEKSKSIAENAQASILNDVFITTSQFVYKHKYRKY